MWKVKRMNTARIVVLTIAVGAGGIAAYLASGSDNSKPPPTEPVVQLPTVDVLVAKSDIGLGQSVKPENLQWQTWPAATASNSFIRRNERPDATNQITGSIAGFIPGSFQAVYNGTKAFLNSFSFALREELRDTKVTVTCLMPGATDTEFFKRAEMMDTDVGTTEKDDPAEVAKNGFEAMMKGESDIVSGFKNKVQSAAANVLPAGILASQHRKMAEPGSAKK